MTAARRDAARQAEKVLRRLLRTPKTRAGLIAAVKNKDISRNFVFGFLSISARTGEVAKLKSTQPPSYQLSTCVKETPSAKGIYPAWLEVRVLPHAVASRVFIDGKPVTTQEVK